MAAPDGNNNARKATEKLIGLISARCQQREEELYRDAAAKLGISPSTFVRESVVRQAQQVVELGVVPEWAKRADSH